MRSVCCREGSPAQVRPVPEFRIAMIALVQNVSSAVTSTMPYLLGIGILVCVAGCTQRPITDRSQGASQERCGAAETQADLTRCWGEVAERNERRVDELFAAVKGSLMERDQAGPWLDDAQTLWRRYRDMQCEGVATLHRGGSAAAMQVANCRARLADQRATELGALLSDTGADGP